MSVSNYLKSLLPSFEAARVREIVSNLEQEIDQSALGSATGLAETFPGNWKWKDKTAETLAIAIKSEYRGPNKLRDANFIELIAQALTNMQSTLPIMRDAANRAFGHTVAPEGLTFNKAVILQYTEAATFFVDYARRLMNYISSAEISQLQGNRTVTGVAPNDQEFLMAKRYVFAASLNIMSIPSKDLKADMGKVPEVMVDASEEADMKIVVGASRMDPFGFASVPFPLSIAYKIGMSFADWQMGRYDSAKREAKVIQYRVILLQQLMQNGKGDAAIEKKLADEEERLKLTLRKIRKMEEDYDLTEAA